MTKAPPKHIAAGEGPVLVAPGGDTSVLKVSGEETGDRFSLSEYTVYPDAGPPLHVHTREEETFYVLDGEVTYWVGGKRIVAGPGSTVFAPRGVEHTFKNCTKTPARMLLMVSPPSNFDTFYTKIGGPRADGSAPSDGEVVERIKKHAGEHGLTILGPNPL